MKRNHEKRAVTLIILTIVAGTAFSQISGTKSVGAGGDYETLSAAVADVMGNGISGHTILELKDGYDENETFIIGNYPGNDQYNLSIRPEAGADQVIIRSAHFEIIRIDSAKHVIIDGRAGGTGSQNVLTMISEFNGNGDAIGIWNQSEKNMIRNCNLLFDCNRGIFMRDADSTTITECDISTLSEGPVTNNTCIGIQINQCENNIISNNVIHNLHVNHDEFTVNGIDYENYNDVGSNDSFYNNFICLNMDRSDSTSVIQGINFWNSAETENPINILFNTIIIGGTNASMSGNSYGIYDREIKRLVNIQNNIVINTRTNSSGTGTHYAICKEKLYGSWTSDYNLLVATGDSGMIGGYMGTDCITLQDWQDSTGFDSHSVSKELVFKDPVDGDLHLTDASFDDPDLKCLPVTGITTDIDGDLRDDKAPYKGADELVAESVSLPLDPASITPFRFALEQAYPNPFNPETTIQFEVKKFCHVVLKVYNMVGQEVVTLNDQYYEPGTYKSIFNASGLSSGIYYYRIQMDNFQAVKKMVILK